MTDPYTLHTLDNGLRVVVERMPDVPSAAAGFLVETGARDDPAPLAGVSHFLEHMMFKGTGKRSWREVTIDFDRLGSVYNAYTSEDRTLYYGWVRKDEIDAQIELLADMLRSTLPPEEFETEKKVVLEEIAMAKDNLDHVAFDFLQEKVYADHPLAWPILGYAETVESMTRDQMWDYFRQRYAPGNVMLIVAGNVDPSRVIGLAEQLCGGWEAMDKGAARAAPKFHGGTDMLTTDRFAQQVVALSFPAVSAVDKRAETAAAAATILGGENSRFFWQIVQTGIAPHAGTFHLDFADCGLMILYGTGRPEAADRLTEAMRTEADRLCREPVQDAELDRVKRKRRTSLALEAEAPYHRLTQLADDMQFYGGPRTVERMLAEVDAVSAEGIQQYFEEFPINSGGHVTSVGPNRPLEK